MVSVPPRALPTPMNLPFFEAHHRQLKSSLESWANAHLHHATVPHDNALVDAVCRDLVKQLGQAGWLKHTIAGVEYGGAAQQIDTRSICLLREELAWHHGLADFALAMQGLGSGAISLFGTAAQKQTYLTAVCRGTKIAAFALSESEAGSDVAAMTCQATESGDAYVLNGQKTWISNGGIADFYIVFARTGEAPGARGISAFIIDADTQGLTMRERIEVVAPHPLATLSLQDVRISKQQLLGQAGQGFKVAMATLDVFRTSVAAAALGFARRAFDEALAWAKARKMFGQTLSDLPLAQAKLADMATLLEAATLLTYRAAWLRDQGNGSQRITREAAMAKMTATENAQKIIDMAVQLHGGMGVKRGSVVESLYREIRSLRIYEGATEVQKLIIGRDLLK